MCGIAAIVSAQNEIPPDGVERMVHALRHRGPDAQNCVQLLGAGLGHARLSVIDLAGGSQPMTEETGRYWIVYNGEVYNYRELRRRLLDQGYRFRTQCDTEVVLVAFRAYGEQVVSHLNGQFAFAIWDAQERRLFAARDRFGEKPFYWCVSPDGHFLLASELKGLLAAGLIAPRIDRAAVTAYLGLLYVPPQRTIYENVQTLRPGHALTWEQGRVRTWPYWRPCYRRTQPPGAPGSIEELRALLAQAVQRQLVADVPVGAYLSGGLDSSTIVALMAGRPGQELLTFSVGFGDDINELPYARVVAERYQTRHSEIQMDIPVGEMLERVADVYDEPFADSSSIPTYLISEFARRHVKVVLSGDGGDELFGGYDWYKLLGRLRAGYAWAMAAGWRVGEWSCYLAAGLGLPVEDLQRATRRSRHAWTSRRRFPDAWDHHLAIVTGVFTPELHFWDDAQTQAVMSDLRSTLGPEADVGELDRATDFDLRCYLPGDILVKVDRASMAHGLETRAPFLDTDLAEFMLSFRWEERFGSKRLKPLLRRACADLWPAALHTRGKQGFAAPVSRWIQRPDVSSLLQRVTQRGSPLRALLRHLDLESPRLGPQQRWTILCLGLWLERHVECLKHLS